MRRATKLSLVIVITFFSFLVGLGYELTRWRMFLNVSTAMEPTIRKDERILAQCHRFPPSRGQLVMYANDEGILIVKRVAAVAGDSIEIRNQHVFVNGSEILEPYVIHTHPGPPANPYMDNLGSQRIPGGHFFVLGDNRDNSWDSRQPEVGPIPESSLMCEVSRVVWSNEPGRRWKSVQ